MYTFLTDEWMEAARGLREHYADRLPDVDIEVRINLHRLEVHFNDLYPSGPVWAVNQNLAVEAPCSEKGRIKNLRTIGGGQ